MDDRSLFHGMTIDPRILTMPGRRTLTDKADIACTKHEVPWEGGVAGLGGGGVVVVVIVVVVVVVVVVTVVGVTMKVRTGSLSHHSLHVAKNITKVTHRQYSSTIQ